ncbi:MAG: ABC transporter substrate-binding protein [Rhodospirillum sp.]|nr:ABC transporter substrate-binding protein [Rhodospirillum sp.]MCF8489961.1 ABC transporter substrate-binding protein [Rhodospirillum sp.]
MQRRHFLAVTIIALTLVAAASGPSLAANVGGRSPESTAPESTAPESMAPESTIERYHSVLLQAMKEAETLGIGGRYTLIDAAARTAFDFPSMAGRATGKDWRDANEADRAAMAEAFGHMSVATYAMRFKGWSGQAFRTLGTDPGPRGTTLVKTQIAAPGGDPVALTYVMNQDGDGDWRIIDILLKGTISELAVKKSEYASILKAKGLTGLAEALNTQADKMLAP